MIKDPEKLKAARKRARILHKQRYPDKVKASKKIYRERHSDRIKSYKKDYRIENDEKIKHQRVLDREKSHFTNMLLKFRKLNRVPKWLTSDHIDQMKDKYSLAREVQILTGDTYNVDHIVPIKGKTVCGLHVPWNLQVLPFDVNVMKSNTQWPDMW